MPYRLVLSIAFLASSLQTQTNLHPTIHKALPEGIGSWSVTVETRGGPTGRGEGDVTVSSEGKIACSTELHCASDFGPQEMRPLIDAMQGVNLPIPAPSIVSRCRDCITSMI